MLLWAGLFVSAGFTYLAIRGVDFALVRDALAASNYWWLVPALGTLALVVAVRALRWQLLFRRETRPSYPAAASALLVGIFFNNILPVRAGEAARIVVLNQQERTSRVEAVGTVVLERALDLLCLLLLLFTIAPWLPPVSWLRPAAVLAVALAAGLVVVAWALARWGDSRYGRRYDRSRAGRYGRRYDRLRVSDSSVRGVPSEPARTSREGWQGCATGACS